MSANVILSTAQRSAPCNGAPRWAVSYRSRQRQVPQGWRPGLNSLGPPGLRARLLRRNLWKSAFPALLLCLSLTPPSFPAEVQKPARPVTLAQRIESILRRPEARRGHWGIEVVRLSDGKVLYTRNAEQLFIPASNMKLFTTAAAVEKLGPNFRFRTTVEVEAPPDGAGRVGDLLLVGRGDPTLGHRVLPDRPRAPNPEPADAVFMRLADQVAARGVREITGNLVADDTYFLFEPVSRGWEEEDLQWGYAAPVTALAFNDNALLIRYRPGGAVGEKARVDLEPFADYYRLNNRLETAPAGTRSRVYVERKVASKQVRVWGEIALDADPDEDSIAIDDPPRWAAEVFRRALAAKGIAVRGQVDVRQVTRLEAATLPSSFPRSGVRIVLAEHFSEPLAEDLKTINKFSQNLHAEMLLRTLGAEVKQYGSMTAGLEVLSDFARESGIEKDEVVFADGSGLSRHSLIAPRATIKLLRSMAKSPRFEVFLDSLPVAGVDGTLDERFIGTAARGRVRAKTGAIEHVNALSGYMDFSSGARLAFAIMGNKHAMKSWEGAAIVDRVVLTIYQQFGGRSRKGN
jgi:D-alanyl-D-alanine carboxypeptidase/D-alanyl-D-alanine-endopeptidase (penicillin-binding protein 4)